MTTALRPRTNWLDFMATSRDALAAATDAMKTLEHDQTTARADLKRLREEYAGIEADARLEVSLTTNGDGKTKYSNESARSDAARQWLRDDPNARRYRADIATAENDLALLESLHNEQRRTRQNLLALLSYATAYMTLRAADPEDGEETR